MDYYGPAGGIDRDPESKMTGGNDCRLTSTAQECTVPRNWVLMFGSVSSFVRQSDSETIPARYGRPILDHRLRSGEVYRYGRRLVLVYPTSGAIADRADSRTTTARGDSSRSVPPPTVLYQYCTVLYRP